MIALLLACAGEPVDTGEPSVVATVEEPPVVVPAEPSAPAASDDALPVPTVWIGVRGNLFSPVDYPYGWYEQPVLDLVRGVDPTAPSRFPQAPDLWHEGQLYVGHGFAERGDLVPGRWRFWWTHGIGQADLEVWEVDLVRGTARRSWHGPAERAPDWVKATGPGAARPELPEEAQALARLDRLPWWTLQLVLRRYTGERATLPGWRSAVQGLLASGDPAIRAAALRWAGDDLDSGQAPTPEQLPSWKPLLLDALDDPVPRVRGWATSLAASSRDPELVRAAAPGRCDPHPTVRRNALAGLSGHLSREQLAPYLLDPDAGVSFVVGNAWDQRPWPDPAVARALLARESPMGFIFEDTLTQPFSTETLRAWLDEGLPLRSYRLDDRGFSLAQDARRCTTPGARLARERLQQEQLPEAAEVEARCADWPDLTQLVAELEPCTPPQPPAYTVDLWSPALAVGPVQLRLLDPQEQVVAHGELPLSPGGTATLQLQPTDLPRTLELRQGETVERRQVPASFGVRVQALCEGAAPLHPPEDLLPWVQRGLFEESCRPVVLASLRALSDEALLPVNQRYPDLLPADRRTRVIEQGLAGDTTATALAQLARLPCEERLAIIEAQPSLDLGRSSANLASCAKESADHWLRIDDLRQAGALLSGSLPVAHEDDPRVRARISQRLVAAAGTADAGPAARALYTLTRSASASSRLDRAQLLALEPGATAYTAALVLPEPCLGPGDGRLSQVDELLVLEPQPAPTVPQVLLLDQEQAQARMLVCEAWGMWSAR